jgi:hypothetical protein
MPASSGTAGWGFQAGFYLKSYRFAGDQLMVLFI